MILSNKIRLTRHAIERCLRYYDQQTIVDHYKSVGYNPAAVLYVIKRVEVDQAERKSRKDSNNVQGEKN